MSEATRVPGSSNEALTRQERLLYVLVENFQPVWREIEDAGVFRRRCLAWQGGLLVPQHVMVGLVMLRGLVGDENGAAGPAVWGDLVHRRDTDREAGRQFKRWMNALTDYFSGNRPLGSADLALLARGLTLAQPSVELTADTLTGELLGYAHPDPSSATRQQRIAAVSSAVLRPAAMADAGTYLADVPPPLASGFQRREVQQQVTEILRPAGRPPLVLSGPAGVGKSQLAAAVLEDFSPDRVIWVSDASTRFAVLEAYARGSGARRRHLRPR